MAEILIMIVGALLLALATVGAVLLITFWAGSKARSTRILLAALIGTALPTVAFMSVAALDGGPGDDDILAILLVTVAPVLIIGWPVAFWATRRTDRLFQNSASVFE